MDAVDERGNTALMRAAIGNNVALVGMLLLRGADPVRATEDVRQYTALMYAQLYGRWGMADAMRAVVIEKEGDLGGTGGTGAGEGKGGEGAVGAGGPTLGGDRLSKVYSREAVDQMQNGIGLTVAESRARCGCAPTSSGAGLWGTRMSYPGMLVREERKEEGEVWMWMGDKLTTGASVGGQRTASQQILPQPPRTPSQQQFKVLLVGDSNAGKAEMLSKYADPAAAQQSPACVATPGIDFKIKNVKLALGPAAPATITAQIWDTAGQERFGTITTAYVRGASAVAMVYNACVPESVDRLRNWASQIIQNGSTVREAERERRRERERERGRERER